MKLKRMTPRTCLWPLTGTLIVTFAFSISLTYVSSHHCYAGVCGELLFSLPARTHVVIWYVWLSLSVAILGFRAFQRPVQRLLSARLTKSLMPLTAEPLCLSGCMVVLWVLSLYGIVIGIWWPRLRDYFGHRGMENGITQGNSLLAAIALTGHLCDITMGMVLLPVSRNSALASFFKLSPSTTFVWHKLLAYMLFVLVSIHGMTYAGWASIFNKHRTLYRFVFPVLNPTYFYHEVWPGDSSAYGVWKASLIFTGSASALILAILFLTTLPSVRRIHFNTFYFTHLCSIVAVVIVCLHASTMLYCTLPGLAMWLLDWGMRIYELKDKVDTELLALGNGWYCLTVPLPRKRLSGCECHSPLAHFYLHHSDSSIREIHPFTTIAHLATKKEATPEDETFVNISFIFRKSGVSASLTTSSGLTVPNSPKQWTNRLANLIDEEANATSPPIITDNDTHTDSQHSTSRTDFAALDSATPTADPQHQSRRTTIHTALRLEGPYFTAATPTLYHTVVCFVAGTGLSGALAIAAAFHALHHHEPQPAVPSSKPRVAARLTETQRTSRATDLEDDESLPGERIHPLSMTMTQPTSRISIHDSVRPVSPRWQRTVVVWTIRDTEYTPMPFFAELATPGLEFRVHKTGQGRRRLDQESVLRDVCEKGRNGRMSKIGKSVEEGDQLQDQSEGADNDDTWVYISGPSSFIDAGEKACRCVRGVEWFAARWD